eukprot:232381-Amphidinium_carterae.1
MVALISSRDRFEITLAERLSHDAAASNNGIILPCPTKKHSLCPYSPATALSLKMLLNCALRTAGTVHRKLTAQAHHVKCLPLTARKSFCTQQNPWGSPHQQSSSLRGSRCCRACSTNSNHMSWSSFRAQVVRRTLGLAQHP